HGKVEGQALGFDDGLGAQILRAGKDVKAFEGEAECADFVEQFRHALGIHAEGFGPSTHAHAGAFQFEVRIDAYRNAGGRAGAFGNVGQFKRFAAGFDVEQYAGGDGLFEFGAGFSGAGEADFVCGKTGFERQSEFAAGGNVETVDAFGHVSHQIGE